MSTRRRIPKKAVPVPTEIPKGESVKKRKSTSSPPPPLASKRSKTSKPWKWIGLLKLRVEILRELMAEWHMSYDENASKKVLQNQILSQRDRIDDLLLKFPDSRDNVKRQIERQEDYLKKRKVEKEAKKFHKETVKLFRQLGCKPRTQLNVTWYPDRNPGVTYIPRNSKIEACNVTIEWDTMDFLEREDSENQPYKGWIQKDLMAPLFEKAKRPLTESASSKVPCELFENGKFDKDDHGCDIPIWSLVVSRNDRVLRDRDAIVLFATDDAIRKSL